MHMRDTLTCRDESGIDWQNRLDKQTELALTLYIYILHSVWRISLFNSSREKLILFYNACVITYKGFWLH